ncbi:MAG: hypothetical protein J5I94_09795, partial [Phaeodactylibacter sp.]|nr:hypothetical protein [Phaeodactylibacter sp.]
PVGNPAVFIGVAKKRNGLLLELPAGCGLCFLKTLPGYSGMEHGRNPAGWAAFAAKKMFSFLL